MPRFARNISRFVALVPHFTRIAIEYVPVRMLGVPVTPDARPRFGPLDPLAAWVTVTCARPAGRWRRGTAARTGSATPARRPEARTRYMCPRLAPRPALCP